MQAEEGTPELKDRSVEIIQPMLQKETRMKKNGQSLRPVVHHHHQECMTCINGSHRRNKDKRVSIE